MAERYLDPKNDIVFKKIFGQHPRILKSFLNALLPLRDDQRIESLVYLQGEQVPAAPMMKNSIVDVKCTDVLGRVFIVEMQMNWTSSFKQRMLFNSCKAYIKQLQKGEEYHLLQPVMGLSVVDDHMGGDREAFYHHYQLINTVSPARIIEDLQLIFIELPNFVPATARLERARMAWLRYLKESAALHTAEDQQAFKQDTLHEPEIGEALELAREAAFSLEELDAYEKYWDLVSTERTMLHDKLLEGETKGKIEGKIEGALENYQTMLSKWLAQGKTEASFTEVFGGAPD